VSVRKNWMLGLRIGICGEFEGKVKSGEVFAIGNVLVFEGR